MIRPVLIGLGVLAAGLSVTIAAELGAFSDATAVVAPVRPMAGATGGRTDIASVDRTAEYAGRILARPLFSPSRRPPAAAEGGAGLPAEAPLPRLAGVMVNGRDRRVIFAAADGSKPLVLGEGERIGAFTVSTIEAGRVTLTGADGPRVLQPQYDTSGALTRPSPGGLAGLPGFAPSFAAPVPANGARFPDGPPGVPVPQIVAPASSPGSGTDPGR